MSITIQILGLLISFLYGFLINIIEKKQHIKNKIIKIISSFILSYILVMVYIIIFYYINGGIFHIYFILSLIIGYLLSNKSVKFKIIKAKIKKH